MILLKRRGEFCLAVRGKGAALNGESRACRPLRRAPEGRIVPKLKSHRGARKRFRLTGSGKVKRNRSMKRHILTSKTTKRKRHLRKSTLVSPAMARTVKKIITA